VAKTALVLLDMNSKIERIFSSLLRKDICELDDNRRIIIIAGLCKQDKNAKQQDYVGRPVVIATIHYCVYTRYKSITAMQFI